jgi:tRNA (cmo5U34)-methyltransferase
LANAHCIRAIFRSSSAGPTVTRDAVAFWSERADRYDGFIRRIVPRYDELIDRLLEYLPASPRRVLELGCGTGNVSLRLAAHGPAAELTLVDGSREMLDIARARLAEAYGARAERFTYIPSTFEALELDAARYDVIVAVLSLHHVRELGPVYRVLRRGLAPGGALRMADGLAAADPGVDALHRRRWRAFWHESGLDDEAVAGVLEHEAAHDHYHSLETHFAMLREAGFVQPDCVWRDGVFAIVTAEVDG